MKFKEDINWWYDWEKSFLDYFKVKKEDYISLYKSQVWSIKDFAWYTYNNLLTQIANAYNSHSITEADFHDKNRFIYGQMTAFQIRFKNEIGTSTWKQQYLSYIKFCQLTFDTLEGFEVFCVSCCKPCDAYYQKKLTVEEAIIHVNTVEDRCCATYGGHRTQFFPIVPEDLNSPIKIVSSFG